MNWEEILIKPCPFCGGIARVWCYYEIGNEKNETFNVVCTKCRIKTKSYRKISTLIKYGIKAWNKRRIDGNYTKIENDSYRMRVFVKSKLKIVSSLMWKEQKYDFPEIPELTNVKPEILEKLGLTPFHELKAKLKKKLGVK